MSSEERFASGLCNLFFYSDECRTESAIRGRGLEVFVSALVRLLRRRTPLIFRGWAQ